jgi:hypothetical protein
MVFHYRNSSVDSFVYLSEPGVPKSIPISLQDGMFSAAADW